MTARMERVVRVELPEAEALALVARAIGPGMVGPDELNGAARIVRAMAAATREPELPLPEATPRKRGRPPGSRTRKPRQTELAPVPTPVKAAFRDAEEIAARALAPEGKP